MKCRNCSSLSVSNRRLGYLLLVLTSYVNLLDFADARCKSPTKAEEKARQAVLDAWSMEFEIIGIDESRVTAIDARDCRHALFADGQMCLNGQKPFGEKEKVKALKFFRRKWKSDLYAGIYLDVNLLNDWAVSKSLNTQCFSNRCTYQPLTASFLCGEMPENDRQGGYDEGKVCLDGSVPPRKYTKVDYEIDPFKQANRILTKNFGKYCKDKKCYAQDYNGAARRYKGSANFYKDAIPVCDSSRSRVAKQEPQGLTITVMAVFAIAIIFWSAASFVD